MRLDGVSWMGAERRGGWALLCGYGLRGRGQMNVKVGRRTWRVAVTTTFESSYSCDNGQGKERAWIDGRHTIHVNIGNLEPPAPPATPYPIPESFLHVSSS